MNKNLEIYGKYGFTEDEELFNQILNVSKLKKLHIDAYLKDPHMLLARISEKNVIVCDEKDNCVVVSKKDKYKTVILDLLLDEISDVVIKKCSDEEYEIIFTVCGNIRYKTSIII